MACPLCGGGKAKRLCPALDQVICATCCGTKRQVEIRCPSSCGWLQSARAHPHAAQQRQQEKDAALVVPLLRGLDDGAYRVLVACLQAAVNHRLAAEPVPRDEDLQSAAAALAATAETSLRGVLYEHQPESLVAARLARAMSAPLAEAAGRGAQGLERATASAMRRVEEVVKAFRKAGTDGPAAFFDFLGRVLAPRIADASTGQPLAALGGSPPPHLDTPTHADGPRIILP